MDYINFLLSIEPSKIKLGLKRTEEFLSVCNNPHKNLPSIQVAGTNGKGSVCAMLAKIFQTAGYKTGLFTSPHLVKINERIRINGLTISDDDIKYFIKKYYMDIQNIGASFFETTTTMAFWYFKKNNVDIAILETGLGGRLDSVTVCEPILTVITPISNDHVEILGNRMDQIAMEKAGILKNNVDCYSSEQQNSVKKVLLKQANNKNTKIHFVQNTNTNKYLINIPGKHQNQNAHLCATALQNIQGFKINKESILKGLKTAKWYGRAQIIKQNPMIIFDVAHNTESLNVFLDYYNTLNIVGNSYLIISINNRKNIQNNKKTVKHI